MTIADQIQEVINFIEGAESTMTKEQIIEFLKERKEIAKPKTRKSDKPTKAQLENQEIAEEIKTYLLDKKAKCLEGATYVFDMKTAFEEIGEERMGKATSVAKMLIEEGFITDVGTMKIGSFKRKCYEVA